MILFDFTIDDTRVIARQIKDSEMLVEFHCLLKSKTVLKIMELSDMLRLVSFVCSEGEKTVPETTYEDAIRLQNWLPFDDVSCRPIA